MRFDRAPKPGLEDEDCPWARADRTLIRPRLKEQIWEEKSEPMEFSYADWPCERSDIEEALLGGRMNAVGRQKAVHDDGQREEWYKMPVRLG